ncbi:MAG: T9SS type A sorting domain-containing protein [Bacteroidota bacterium]
MKKLMPLTLMLALCLTINAQDSNHETLLNTLFISDAGSIIECPKDQGDLFVFANRFNYNHFILYGIKNYIKDLPENPVDQLGQFILTAHEFGITVSINVASYDGSVDIRNYWEEQLDPVKKYDGLHLEKEYWHGTGSKCHNQEVPFLEYLEELTAIYNFCHGSQNGGPPRGLVCETYLGNPCHNKSRPTADGQKQVNQIVQYSDRVYLAYYKEDPFSPSKGIFHSKLYRLDYFCNAVDDFGNPVNTDVSLLFNAHQDNPNESDDMFDWLNKMADNGTPYEDLFTMPYKYWLKDDQGYFANRDFNVNNLKFPKSHELFNVNILGHGWYKYQALQEVMGHPVGNCENAIVPLIAEYNTPPLILPNPANREIKINLPDNFSTCTFSIINLNGQLMLNGVLFEKINLIDVSDLSEGTYFVKFEQKNKSQFLVEKLVIKK